MQSELLVPRLESRPLERGWLEVVSSILQRAWKRWKPASVQPAERLRVVDRLSLGPKKSLLVVACRGRHFLISNGAENVVAIAELSPRAARRRAGKHAVSMDRLRRSK